MNKHTAKIILVYLKIKNNNNIKICRSRIGYRYNNPNGEDTKVMLGDFCAMRCRPHRDAYEYTTMMKFCQKDDANIRCLRFCKIPKTA